MTRRRLVPLALLVAALLGVAALAAHGRPLGGGGSAAGPSSDFLNYVYTAFVIVVIALGVVMIWLFVTSQPAMRPMGHQRRNRLATVLFLALMGLLFWGLTLSHFEKRLRELEQRLHLTRKPKSQSGPQFPGGKPHKGAHSAQLRWEEVAIVLALLGALGVAAFAANRRRPVSPSWQFASQAAVSAALDESLDDLRSEPDLRKAIIAAYARMEQALALAGLPRRPSEAPLEYVERALGELETSAGAIRRLTDLFEWAKFSHHEPEASMRDEAIDALVAVRDELRRPAAEPVAA